MADKLLVLMAGATLAFSPLLEARTCQPGKSTGASTRCKEKPPARSAKAGRDKAGKKGKAGIGAPRGLVEFVDSKGCRLFAAESAARRMREIDAVGSVTWDGKCQGGLASGPGVLRQEGMSVEGGRSKRFAYYFSGTAQKGVRTGPWTRETFDRFADSPKSWTSLARMEFVQGVAKGALKPVPVGGQNQHTDAFRTRVLEPDSKRDLPAEPAVSTPPSLIVADSLSSKPATAQVQAPVPAPLPAPVVAASAAPVVPPAVPVAPPAPAPALRPARVVEAPPPTASAAAPVAAPLPAPVSAPAPELVTGKALTAKLAIAPVAAPAPAAKAVAPVPGPVKDVVARLTPELPTSLAEQSFAFGTGCYMDALDGRIWEGEVLTVKDRKAIRIHGWGVDEEEKRVAEATFLRLEGSTGKRYYAATTLEDRPDVAKFLGNGGLLRSGYRTLFSAENVPAGDYEVMIVMSSGGRNILCGNGRKLKIPGI
jgi:hypothetical protein